MSNKARDQTKLLVRSSCTKRATVFGMTFRKEHNFTKEHYDFQERTQFHERALWLSGKNTISRKSNISWNMEFHDRYFWSNMQSFGFAQTRPRFGQEVDDKSPRRRVLVFLEYLSGKITLRKVLSRKRTLLTQDAPSKDQQRINAWSFE